METPPESKRPAWREPIWHFLVLGALLFGLDLWMNPLEDAYEELDTIEIPAAILPQGADKARRDAAIARYTREEVLFREAQRLGFARSDLIVRRRMVQKMEFLLEDRAEVPPPSPKALQAWYEDNKDDYQTPAKVTFEHLFFANDRHGGADGAQKDAQEALKAANAGENPPSDPFVAGQSFKKRDRAQLAKVFGEPFAQQVTQMSPGPWRGPVKSAFGAHLIKVTAVESAGHKPFEKVKDAVQEAWDGQARKDAAEKALQDLMDRYKVTVETPAEAP